MLKILIADDEEMTRNGLAQYIDWGSLGIESVQTARNGIQALSFAQKTVPDILLTDIMMPHMDGIELTKKFRKVYPECRVVLFSGHADKDYLKSAINLHVDAYIDKPIDMDKVCYSVKKLAEDINKERNYAEINLPTDFEKYDSKVKKGVIYIFEKYHQADLSIGEIAENVGLSQNYFATLFKQNCGMTVNDYLTMVRLKHAERLLKDSNKKLYEIAEEIGISDSNYLNTVFKRRYGLTPSQYRKNS